MLYTQRRADAFRQLMDEQYKSQGGLNPAAFVAAQKRLNAKFPVERPAEFPNMRWAVPTDDPTTITVGLVRVDDCPDIRLPTPAYEPRAAR